MEYSLLFLLSMFIALFLTPLFKIISFKFEFLDIPKENRKVHKVPMPFLGGIIIYISFLMTLTLQTNFVDRTHLIIIVSSTLILIGGVIDDIYPMKPKGKLLIQVCSIFILIVNDIYIREISFFPSPFVVDLKYLGIPITFAWIILVTNAFNLIDGLDGLAIGVSFIASFSLFIIGIISKNISSTIISIVLCGTLFGVLPYNFYKAKIFIGDSGSQFIGFILAVIGMNGSNSISGEFIILIPVVIYGLPLFDACSSIIRRKLKGRSWMEADKDHIHHKLIQRGNSHPKAVFFMYVISLIFSIIGIIMVVSDIYIFILLVILVIVICFCIAKKLDIFNLKDSKDK